MDQFQKRRMTLRTLLSGKEFYNAMLAMEFAQKHHVGFRKDGVTPEFDHQVSIALFALTLPKVMFPEELIATIMLHDTPEDYDVSLTELEQLFVDQAFALRVSRAVGNMTKEFRGQRKDDVLLFDAMAEDPIASLAKLCDRIHNANSMVGVFSISKQKEYLEEIRTLFLPMGKKARRNFPHQKLAYENCKYMLVTQLSLIEAIHEALEPKV